MRLYDRVKQGVTGAPGTGAITLGAAIVGYLTYAQAGASAGDVVRYLAEDGAAWELGWSPFGATLSRNVLASSAGGAAVNLTSAAVVSVAPVAADVAPGARNRLINGDMRIDQRRAGAAYTPAASDTYLMDRWRIQVSQATKLTFGRNLNAIAPPAGFTHALGVSVGSAYTPVASDYFALVQPIEGMNMVDWAWGTPNARPVTLSFWIQSSVAGTYGGSLKGGATQVAYTFSFSIPVANTWTYIAIPIIGETSHAWATDNTVGVFLTFSLGMGPASQTAAGVWVSGIYNTPPGCVNLVATAGATLSVTGVQLESGHAATPFERRLYAQELALCQRYFQRWDYSGAYNGSNGYFMPAICAPGQNIQATASFLALMRATPTCASSMPSGRFVNSSVGASTVPIAAIAAMPTGPLVMFLTNNASLPACFGWVDSVGVLTADAEL